MVIQQKILVTGSNGQLGRELQELCSAYPQYSFSFLTKEELPIHDPETLRQQFKRIRPQYLVNCAAYTAVDKAEEEKELAFRINGDAVGEIASVCKEQQVRMIHVSTDYVFNGNASAPYKEDDPVDPQNVYGASKLEGERLGLLADPSMIIIRTSWVYSEFGKNFVRTMLKLMHERDEISVVNDQLGSPTYAADLANAIMRIISSSEWKPGIYHYCNEGVISWYDFAIAIKELADLSCKVNPIPTSAYPTPAKRPAYSVLDTTRIRDTYAMSPKNWKDSLAVCLKRLI
jgi:dTDP-4-dehydrorhamnose reductase